MEEEMNDFTQSEFDFKNISDNRFKFLIFKSKKNMDMIAFYYSTPAKLYGDDSKSYIGLFEMSTKEKIKEYIFPYHIRNIEHYCLNDMDLLLVIHDYNSIIIYDIEKDEPIKTIENPAENSVLNFAEVNVYKMYYCPAFIHDKKIKLITNSINDDCVKLWDFDSCKLLKRVDKFKSTFCLKVFTDDNNNNYLIVANSKLISYTLPDFQKYKLYYIFDYVDKRKFLIDKINNNPYIFFFEGNTLNIYEFYSGNSFKTIKFNLKLDLSNIILWDDDNVVISEDDSLFLQNGSTLIYNLNKNKVILSSVKGYSFVKYEYKGSKYLFYNFEQKSIKALKLNN